MEFKGLTNEQREWLERPFEEGEVKKIIWSIEDDKAPSLDGFSMAFYTIYWEVVKGDVMGTMENFHQELFLNMGSNATYLANSQKRRHGHE